MIKIGKALSAAVLLPLICGMFGCGKAQEYNIDDIISVSVSCGHMDYSYSYSFYIRKVENEWLLDADFATDTESPHTVYECRTVTNEDAEGLLNTVREQNLTEKLKKYKEPKTKYVALDEAAKYTSILFSDGERIGAATVNNELHDCFLRMGKKYADTAFETDNTQTDTEEEQ